MHWVAAVAARVRDDDGILVDVEADMQCATVLKFFIADLRSRGERQRAFGGSDLTEANPRVETKVSLFPRQSLCLDPPVWEGRP